MRKYWALAANDLRLELRQKDSGVLILAFGALQVLLLGFALGSRGTAWRVVEPGILWMGFLYAGMLSVTRMFARDMPEEVLTGLVLAPGGRMPVFLAKLSVTLLFMLATELVVTPLYTVFFGTSGRAGLWPMGLVLALGALGIVAVGTLMAAIGANLSGHDLLMPVLLMPLLVPVAITAVEATGALWRGADAWAWIHGLMAYDAIFLGMPFLVYEFLWEV